MFYKKNNLSLYYETHGEGRPMLMLHGFECDHLLMKGCMEPIFQKAAHSSGWKRIYLDLPGMGQSKAPHLKNTDEILEVLLEFINKTISGPFLLVGESYGGYLARGILNRLQLRVEGLLLICPLIVAEPSKRSCPKASVRKRDAAFMERLDSPDKADFESIAVVQTEETWNRYRQEILPGFKAKDSVFCDRLFSTGYAFGSDIDPLPTPFDKPGLILTGLQDHVVGYQDALKLLSVYSHTSFHTLDHAGHNLHIEQPELFEALVQEWLERLSTVPV